MSVMRSILQYTNFYRNFDDLSETESENLSISQKEENLLKSFLTKFNEEHKEFENVYSCLKLADDMNIYLATPTGLYEFFDDSFIDAKSNTSNKTIDVKSNSDDWANERIEQADWNISFTTSPMPIFMITEVIDKTKK